MNFSSTYVVMDFPSLGEDVDFDEYKLICALIAKNKINVETEKSFDMRILLQGTISSANVVNLRSKHTKNFLAMTIDTFAKYWNVAAETNGVKIPLMKFDFENLCSPYNNCEYGTTLAIDINSKGKKLISKISDRTLAKRADKIKAKQVKGISRRENIVKIMTTAFTFETNCEG